MGKIKWSNFLPLFGLVLFVAIVWNAGFYKLLGVFKNINLVFFFFALLLNVVVISTKALKWQLIIKSCGLDYPLPKCISSWMVGYSAGLVTPGRVGDFYRAIHLKNYGNNSIGKSLATVIFDRLVDIAVMVILAALGLLMLIRVYDVPFNFALSVIPIVLLLILVFISLKKNISTTILRPLFYKIIPTKYQSNIRVSFYEFFDNIHLILRNKARLLQTLILAVSVWFIIFLANYLLLLSLNVNVSYFFIAFITPFINIVELLPISISGIGTRDAALILLLSIVLVPPHTAVAFSITILIGGYIVGLIGLLIWLNDSKKWVNA